MRFWQSHFKGDTGVPGRAVQLNKHPYTILGVAPPQFRGTELYFSPDFWVPIVNQEQIAGANDLKTAHPAGIWLVGRLKPGVTPAQAASDLNSIAASLAKAYPKEDGQASFSLARPGLLGNMLGRPVRAFVTGLMLLAGLILLAACANLGSLFAARAADRSKEIALRLALGSSRKRILRQLLTEAVLVSIAGGIAGVLGSVVLLRWLSAWQPLTDMPINVPVNPDANVYAVALLLALASGFLFGIVPVRQVLRANPYQIVKSGSTGTVGRRSRPAIFCSFCRLRSARCWSLLRWSLCGEWRAPCIATSASSPRTQCWRLPTWTWPGTAAIASRPCSGACSIPCRRCLE